MGKLPLPWEWVVLQDTPRPNHTSHSSLKTPFAHACCLWAFARSKLPVTAANWRSQHINHPGEAEEQERRGTRGTWALCHVVMLLCLMWEAPGMYRHSVQAGTPPPSTTIRQQTAFTLVAQADLLDQQSLGVRVRDRGRGGGKAVVLTCLIGV